MGRWPRGYGREISVFSASFSPHSLPFPSPSTPTSQMAFHLHCFAPVQAPYLSSGPRQSPTWSPCSHSSSLPISSLVQPGGIPKRSELTVSRDPTLTPTLLLGTLQTTPCQLLPLFRLSFHSSTLSMTAYSLYSLGLSSRATSSWKLASPDCSPFPCLG